MTTFHTTFNRHRPCPAFLFLFRFPRYLFYYSTIPFDTGAKSPCTATLTSPLCFLSAFLERKGPNTTPENFVCNFFLAFSLHDSVQRLGGTYSFFKHSALTLWILSALKTSLLPPELPKSCQAGFETSSSAAW